MVCSHNNKSKATADRGNLEGSFAIYMTYIYNIIFFLICSFILMQLFRFSTYHKYFYKVVILLVIQAILVGYLLFKLNWSQFFLWYLIFFIILLVNNYKKQKETAGSIMKKNEDKLINQSINNTLKYHLFSSVVYISVFFISFIYFYNA